MTTDNSRADALTIRDLIANDAYAMSFQTMAQYRTALLAALNAPSVTKGREAFNAFFEHYIDPAFNVDREWLFRMVCCWTAWPRTSSPVEQHEAAPAADAQKCGCIGKCQDQIGCPDKAWKPSQSVRHEAAPAGVREVAQWQYRHCSKFSALPDWCDWQNCSKDVATQYLKSPETSNGFVFEVRALYAAPLEGTGNGADKRAVFETWAKERFPAKYLSSDANSNMDDYRECAWEGFQRGCTYARAPRTEVAGAVPEGWKLVPEVITQPMMRASGIGSHSWGCALEAAPQPPSADAAAASQPISCKCRSLGDWDGAHHPLCDGAASQPASAAGQDAVSFQSRVQPWMLACFGAEIAADRIERNHRFLEEALELVQAIGCTASEAHQLVDYTFGRPNGEPAQEVGGVMVTLAALCLANDLDMHAAGETELARVWTKVEQIRAKQAAKPKHSPLPEAAPPAQVATRQGLTDEQQGLIEAARRVIGGGVARDVGDGDVFFIVGLHDAERLSRALILLDGDKHV
ncbi:hypothetical protein [Burkholderia anthina]|uniref:hypothetical protein n=1 Tax=Burkholderia anthina TaxID=179879 RepID=UPI001FC839C4|nr:hypothetical protein [Burkholderia anthina]